MKNQRPLVLYHADCNDGFCAAWMFSRRPEAASEEGQAILRYQDRLVESAVAYASETEFDEINILCVNSACLVLEIGQALAKGRPFGVIWFATEDRVVYSLRSDIDGADVS